MESYSVVGSMLDDLVILFLSSLAMQALRVLIYILLSYRRFSIGIGQSLLMTQPVDDITRNGPLYPVHDRLAWAPWPPPPPRPPPGELVRGSGLISLSPVALNNPRTLCFSPFAHHRDPPTTTL